MARVTIEDCIDKVNRFELVIVSARRAREIAAGAPITVERDNDKNPVVALREVAEDTLDLNNLKEGVIKTMQRAVVSENFDDEPEEERPAVVPPKKQSARSSQVDSNIVDL